MQGWNKGGVGHIRIVMDRLGLPVFLVDSIRNGTLEKDVEEAFAVYRRLTEALDAWELANPHAAKQCPWYEAREAWKAAGRPDPDWWEVLRTYTDPKVAITTKNVTQKLLCKYPHTKRDRLRAERAAAGLTKRKRSG